MGLLDWLLNIDTQIFLTINEAHNAFFDQVMVIFTSKEIWIPLYLSILLVGFRKFNSRFLWVFLLLVMLIVICDQSSFWLKQVIERYRPGHEPALAGKVHLPMGPRGLYGFFSSHASNAFGLAVFTSMLYKNKRYTWLVLTWSVLVVYTRVYLGLHYPLDLIVGAIWGSALGWGMFKLLMMLDDRRLRRRIIRTGALKNDEIHPIRNSFFFTLVIVLISVYLLQ